MNDPLQPKPTDEVLRWYLLQKKVKEDRISRAFELFRAQEIEPILIKGWAAALSYPPGIPRHFTDTDLAVAAGDYEKAVRLCGPDEFAVLNIDVHRELRHLDILPWEDLFENSRLVKIDGTSVRILRPEDHLRVICVHWLTDGGANRNRLWDIYYSVANRPTDFDWDRCLEVVSQTRRKWIIYSIGIAHRYLGLDLDDLPFATEAGKFPRWMRTCIESEWASGVRLEPVAAHLNSPGSLLKQIWKRIPPNPIRATIEMEGRMDARTRVFYQLGSFAKMLTHPLGHRLITRPSGRKNDK